MFLATLRSPTTEPRSGGTAKVHSQAEIVRSLTAGRWRDQRSIGAPDAATLDLHIDLRDPAEGDRSAGLAEDDVFEIRVAQQRPELVAGYAEVHGGAPVLVLEVVLVREGRCRSFVSPTRRPPVVAPVGLRRDVTVRFPWRINCLMHASAKRVTTFSVVNDLAVGRLVFGP